MVIPEALQAVFDTLSIGPACHVHPPLMTSDDAAVQWDRLDGWQVKNLFLKDAGGQLWLVVLPCEPLVDTKILATVIGSKRISFGSAALLLEVLGVIPGSVTPLAIMNDRQRQVRLVIHAGIMHLRPLLVHPLINTATLELQQSDLLRFLAHHDVMPEIVDLSAAFRQPVSA